MIKIIYFNEVPWDKCYKDVAKLFTELKINAQKFYVDKNRMEILKELSKYSQEDIKEMFHV